MSHPIVHINDDRGSAESPPPIPRLDRAIRAVLSTGRADGSRVSEAEVSITFVEATRMRELNRRYHAVDAPTDVLAFDLGGDGLLGDVYVCWDVASRAAREHGVALDEELVRLAIHGTLHLLGHDHSEGPDRESEPMFLLQERLVAESRAP